MNLRGYQSLENPTQNWMNGCQDHKIETHYASMQKDEEDATKIAKREVEASVCEVEQEHINTQRLHCNVDGADHGESQCDETHVDDDYKVRCELVNLAATDGFGEVKNCQLN